MNLYCCFILYNLCLLLLLFGLGECGVICSIFEYEVLSYFSKNVGGL